MHNIYPNVCPPLSLCPHEINMSLINNYLQFYVVYSRYCVNLQWLSFEHSQVITSIMVIYSAIKNFNTNLFLFFMFMGNHDVYIFPKERENVLDSIICNPFFIASFATTEYSTTQVLFNHTNKWKLYKPTAYACTGVRRTVFILLKYWLWTHPSTLTHSISPVGVKQFHFRYSHVRSKRLILYNCYCLLILKQQKEVKLLLSASGIFMKQTILSGIHSTRLHFIMKWDPGVNSKIWRTLNYAYKYNKI